MKPTETLLALHGGAGTLRRAQMSASDEARYREALRRMLADGQRLLLDGAPALDVVTEVVRQLEECELFNAGKGAVYTAAGTHELDASLMDGRDLRAGAVAGLARTRNPVLAARAVMERGEHLMFCGAAADAYAAALGLEQVDNSWFGTPQRLAQLRAAQAAANAVVLDHDGQASLSSRVGTVGAVARDAQGHLAAATSTGGMTNKKPGRVGDSPLIGAGCYANDASVAVSCTGTGEAFIRCLAAAEVSALVLHRGWSLQQATDEVIHQRLPAVQGQGGLIAVSARGELCMPFNTEGMYRGSVRGAAAPEVFIYGDESTQQE